jgi:hypothetical protein
MTQNSTPKVKAKGITSMIESWIIPATELSLIKQLYGNIGRTFSI